MNTPTSIGNILSRLFKRALLELAKLVMLVVIIFGIFFWWTGVHVFSTSRFVRENWLAPVSGESARTCYRGGMARDIENRVLVPGMARHEVEALLGTPQHVDLTRGFQYTLGMCSGFRMDYDVLHVFFDGEEMLTRTAILQH